MPAAEGKTLWMPSEISVEQHNVNRLIAATCDNADRCRPSGARLLVHSAIGAGGLSAMLQEVLDACRVHASKACLRAAGIQRLHRWQAECLSCPQAPR